MIFRFNIFACSSSFASILQAWACFEALLTVLRDSKQVVFYEVLKDPRDMLASRQITQLCFGDERKNPSECLRIRRPNDPNSSLFDYNADDRLS